VVGVRGKEREMERLEGTEQNHRDTEEERQKEKVKGQKDGSCSGLQTATAQTAGTPPPAAVCKETAGTRTEQGGSGTNEIGSSTAEHGPETAPVRGTDVPGTDVRGTDVCGTGSAKLPKWREVAGLTVENEGTMTRSERRYALRKLFRYYESLVREHLKEHEADPEKDERTFLWDPVPTICFELGIARSKLSSLTKELTGMAAHEVVDKVRAEGIEKKMRGALARTCRKELAPGRNVASWSKYAKWPYWGDVVWDVVKRSRRQPWFDRTEWAQRFGFPNYARMRRGVMLAKNGLTPMQVEGQIIDEYEEYFVLAGTLQNRGTDAGEGNWARRKEQAGKPYEDRWARALKERPEWMAQMRAELGLAAELQEWSRMTHKPALTPKEAEDVAWEAEQERKKAEKNAT
jgi:AraC-like DNA-binding protein